MMNTRKAWKPRKPGESKATFAPVLRRGVAELRHALRCLQGQIFKQWGVPTGVAQGCLSKSFLQDNPRLKSNMVPWYSRRILTLAVFLLLFIILSLVMTGLFIWRALFHDSKNSEGSTVNPSISISQVSCLACSKKAHIFKHQSPFPNGLKIWYASSLFNE